MTSDVFTRLEASFEIKLPKEYLDVMQSYPFPAGHFGVEMLANDAEVLEQCNRPISEKRARGRFWPSLSNGYFWIGSDGSELSFYVKLGRESCGVWYHNIETGTLQKYCDSVGDYVRKCQKIDADEERLPNELSGSPSSKYGLCALALLVSSVLAGLFAVGYEVFRAIRWLLH